MVSSHQSKYPRGSATTGTAEATAYATERWRVMAPYARAPKGAKELANARFVAAGSPQSQEDTREYDVLAAGAAFVLRKGEPLPLPLAAFVIGVLEGSIKRPTRRGPDSALTAIRDSALSFLTHEIASKFKLPLYTTNELSTKSTAALIVADVARVKHDTVLSALRRFPTAAKVMGSLSKSGGKVLQ